MVIKSVGKKYNNQIGCIFNPRYIWVCDLLDQL